MGCNSGKSCRTASRQSAGIAPDPLVTIKQGSTGRFFKLIDRFDNKTLEIKQSSYGGTTLDMYASGSVVSHQFNDLWATDTSYVNWSDNEKPHKFGIGTNVGALYGVTVSGSISASGNYHVEHANHVIFGERVVDPFTRVKIGAVSTE